ncbi:MAG: HDOD domain-containing protein, partial [Phycisphaerae bacterium]|nr:HDOD domain-containing protein [Phycisphaerae bacterium]
MVGTKLEASQPNERVELILAQLDNLPTLPSVATRVLELTTASDSNAREVTRLVESDQSLTAKILAMTRRASTGVRSEVSTIDRAVVLLGFDAIRNAVLSIKIFETFARRAEPEDTEFDRTEFWKHSLAVACGAQLAAQELRGSIEPEQAFVCGLLHDIGKVALDACLPKSYDRVVRRTNTARACVADMERELLGVDHTVVGHRLAQRWRFPQALTECIWLHHHGPSALPASVKHADAVRLVHFADRLARELRVGYSGNYHPDAPALALAEAIGLTPAQFGRITAELTSRIEERAHLIGLDQLTSQELYVRALADANDELSRANAQLASSNRQLTMRSRYFAAMNEMNRRIAGAATHGHVCAAAADAIRTALEVPAAAVFFASPSMGLLHVGVATEPNTPVRSLVWDTLMFVLPEVWSAVTDPTTSGVSFLPAATVAPGLAERVAAEAGVALPWLCPVIQDGRCSAGLLIAGEMDAGARWAQESAELGAMVTAIRLWLGTVESQYDAQRLNEELSDINRRLQQAQGEAARTRSLSMIAEMAAGAAHELNNPLAVISGRAQMLQSSPPDEATERIARVLAEQAQRCSHIVAELMQFAKPD